MKTRAWIDSARVGGAILPESVLKLFQIDESIGRMRFAKRDAIEIGVLTRRRLHGEPPL